MIKINLIAEAPAAAAAKRKKSEGARAAAGAGVRKADLILLLVLLAAVAVTGGRWYLLKKQRDQMKRTEAEMRVERDRLQPLLH